MERRYLFFGTLLFSFVYIFESSFFIGKEQVQGISGEDLYLDKSFFECARQSSCLGVPRKAREGATNESWDKGTNSLNEMNSKILQKSYTEN